MRPASSERWPPCGRYWPSPDRPSPSASTRGRGSRCRGVDGGGPSLAFAYARARPRATRRAARRCPRSRSPLSRPALGWSRSGPHRRLVRPRGRRGRPRVSAARVPRASARGLVSIRVGGDPMDGSAPCARGSTVLHPHLVRGVERAPLARGFGSAIGLARIAVARLPAPVRSLPRRFPFPPGRRRQRSRGSSPRLRRSAEAADREGSRVQHMRAERVGRPAAGAARSARDPPGPLHPCPQRRALADHLPGPARGGGARGAAGHPSGDRPLPRMPPANPVPASSSALDRGSRVPAHRSPTRERRARPGTDRASAHFEPPTDLGSGPSPRSRPDKRAAPRPIPTVTVGDPRCRGPARTGPPALRENPACPSGRHRRPVRVLRYAPGRCTAAVAATGQSVRRPPPVGPARADPARGAPSRMPPAGCRAAARWRGRRSRRPVHTGNEARERATSHHGRSDVRRCLWRQGAKARPRRQGP